MIPIAAVEAFAGSAIQFVTGSTTGKLIALAVLAAVLVGGYSYWHHSVYKSGYDAASLAFAERDAKANAKIESMMDENRRKLKALADKHEQEYSEGVTKYAKDSKALNSKLSDANARLRLFATVKSDCADRMSSASGISEGGLRRSPQVQESELDRETTNTLIANAYEVEQAKLAVGQALEFIDRNFTLK